VQLAGEKMAPKPRTKTKGAPVPRLIPGGEDRERSVAIIPIVEAGKDTRFKPGQSGNPSGRTSYSALSSAYKHQLGCQLDEETAHALKLSPNATVAEAIAVVLSRCALAGDVNAARELCNRVEGQAPQFLALATNAQPKTEVTIRVVEAPPLPKPEGTSELFDGLLNLVRTSNNPELMTAAANLARLLRKHGNKRTA
jgi:hypothetical protein